jgi:hypothetical protein
MAKIKNNFLSGILDKNNDVRLVESDTLVDAENFLVLSTESSNRGVGKNVPGTVVLTSNVFVNPEELGSKSDTANNKIYYFIKTDTFDYIFEFDTDTNTNVIVLQSTAGTRLNFQTGKKIINIDIIYSGEVYDSSTASGGNLLLFSGDDNPPRIINIERAKTYGVDGFEAEEIMLIKAPPLRGPQLTLLSTISETENFIKDKFISFATRYKYKDGYYSAISSWSEYAFDPKTFSIDFNSKENKGMINLYNSVDIKFETGPREVISIDLVMKYSNDFTVYKIDEYNKIDNSWGDNILIPAPINFDNSKVFSILPASEYTRNFDNIPESCVAQTLLGTRIAFANYKEGKNMIDKNGEKVVMSYSVGVNSTANSSVSPVITKLNSVSPFDGSTIVGGKIQVNFTGIVLNSATAILLGFNAITLPISPQTVPPRNTDVFQGLYNYFVPSDYANISDLVNDTANNFKAGLEGYFSRTLRNEISKPTDAYDFPPDEPPLTPPYSTYNGFTISVISPNVIEIVYPTTQFTINNVDPDPDTTINEYYTENASQFSVDLIGSRKSMKSYRSYEIAMVHRDSQGRKTTATVSKNNTIFIPVSSSNKKNVLTVDLSSQMPPAWATSYKFAIKENIKTYEEIYISQFYEEGYLRWLKIDGVNVNKIKDQEFLLVKRDSFNVLATPVLTKILELKEQPVGFLPTPANVPAGLYALINPAGFSMPYDPDSYREFNVSGNARSGHPTVPIEITGAIPNGSVMTINVSSWKGGTSTEDNSFSLVVTANSDYASFAEFYNTQISPIPFKGKNAGGGVDFGGIYPKELVGNTIRVTGTSDGSPSIISPNRGFVEMNISLRTTAGMLIFETLGTNIADGIFYETPDIFPIVNGQYVENGTDVINYVHYLTKTFNCYMQGNGAESYQIQDSFNARYLSIDFSPTAVSESEYRQVTRFADITYSEPYNSNTSVNRLNEFNLSLGNFKDDIDKTFGPIMKMAGLDTNLELFQVDKDSIVYYGKDLLYNADGTTNLTGIPQVLGTQKTYEGEYGISMHPESYARYGFNTYHTDVKRGVVVKKANNGLFEISSQGMTNYFKQLFTKTTILSILGEYDQYYDMYVLNIKYIENSVTKFVTWYYSDTYNGWCTRMSYNPAELCRLNNNLYSLYSGQLYIHNQRTNSGAGNYNVFYGILYDSTFEFNFSQEPSEVKILSTLEVEGTTALDIITETNLSKGYIKFDEFELKEGMYYAYIRNENDVQDTSLLSFQGVGVPSISGLTLSFDVPIDTIISAGDNILNANLGLVGTITDRTEKTLVLNTVLNLNPGDYVLCSKPQSIAVNSMLGYYMNVKAKFKSNTEKEIFAINAEVVKSYM